MFITLEGPEGSGKSTICAKIIHSFPSANLLLALGSTVALRLTVMIMGVDGAMDGPVGYLLWRMIYINLLLMLFNLIPLPPLDGHYVLHYFLPRGGQRILESIGPFGIIRCRDYKFGYR